MQLISIAGLKGKFRDHTNCCNRFDMVPVDALIAA
jgi:hypothetical protein